MPTPKRHHNISVEIPPLTKHQMDQYRRHTPEPPAAEEEPKLKKQKLDGLKSIVEESDDEDEVKRFVMEISSDEDEDEVFVMEISDTEEESEVESEEERGKNGKKEKKEKRDVVVKNGRGKSTKESSEPADDYSEVMKDDGMSQPRFKMTDAFKAHTEAYLELISPRNDPTKPLPELVFPPRDGVFNRLNIQYEYHIRLIRKLVDSPGSTPQERTKNWNLVAEKLDYVAFQDIPVDYLTFNPTFLLLIKRIAFDYPPPLNGLSTFYPDTPKPDPIHYEDPAEGRARNLAAILWSRYYLNIFDTHPTIYPKYDSPKYYPSGSIFPNRAALLHTKLHRSSQGGISGRRETGALSIVLSHSDYADVDHGTNLWYAGTASKDGVTATANTVLLQQAMGQGNKVRVFRAKGCGWLEPAWGIRYDGLYTIHERKGSNGNYKFLFKREPGQWPIFHPMPRFFQGLARKVKEQVKKEVKERKKELERQERDEARRKSLGLGSKAVSGNGNGRAAEGGMQRGGGEMRNVGSSVATAGLKRGMGAGSGTGMGSGSFLQKGQMQRGTATIAATRPTYTTPSAAAGMVRGNLGAGSGTGTLQKGGLKPNNTATTAATRPSAAAGMVRGNLAAGSGTGYGSVLQKGGQKPTTAATRPSAAAGMVRGNLAAGAGSGTLQKGGLKPNNTATTAATRPSAAAGMVRGNLGAGSGTGSVLQKGEQKQRGTLTPKANPNDTLKPRNSAPSASTKPSNTPTASTRPTNTPTSAARNTSSEKPKPLTPNIFSNPKAKRQR